MKAMLLGMALLGLSACSVAQPAWKTADVSRVQLTDENHRSFCGGTAVGVHTVLTAGHCVLGSDLSLVGINGQKASLQVLAYDEADHVLLSTTLDLVPAAVGPAPKFGDEVVLIGMPKGTGPFLRKGYYMGAVQPGAVGPWPMFLDVYDVMVDNGDSGSGVFDSKGRLVGVVSVVLQSPRTTSWGPMGSWPLVFSKEELALIK